MSSSCGVIFVEYCELLDGGDPKKKKNVLDADDVITSKRAKITE